MSDVGEFNNSIAKIDSELSGLRTSNRELMNENRELRESIGSLSGLKDVFSDTEGELHHLRMQLKQFQLEQLKMEHALRQELQDAMERIDDLKKQLAEYKSRAETAESALVRYRSVVGEDAANIVEMKVRLLLADFIVRRLFNNFSSERRREEEDEFIRRW